MPVYLRSSPDRFEKPPLSNMRTSHTRLLYLIVPLLCSACAEQETPPAFHVAEVPVPEAAIGGFQEAERQTLADLLGLGVAIARGEVDDLIEPLIERERGAAALSVLPVHLGAERMGLGGAELEAAYSADPEWELVVRHLVRLVDSTSPRQARQQARMVAEEAAARARAGEDFARLAAQFSEEPGAAERGGLLQPGRRGSWVEPFWEAAAALDRGETSSVVETQYGYHVLRLEERRPVPFGEASRTALLQRAVPASVAAAAMESWAARHAGILVDPPSVTIARMHLAAGTPLPDTLVVAEGAGGRRYDGSDLAAGWARLDPRERVALEQADDSGFAAWLERDARQAIWAELTREMGIEPPPATSPANDWLVRVLRWSHVFGFREGMSEEQVRNAALQGVRSGAAEARAARQEIRSLRPRLRALYPMAEPAG
jgi:hypothetical protein